MRRLIRITLLLALLSGGCAPAVKQAPPPEPKRRAEIVPVTQVVLLPDPDGRVGLLDVSNEKGSQVLDQAWQGTEAAGRARPGEPKVLGEEQVRRLFADALAAEPLPPVSFLLHFRTGSAALSPESTALLERIAEGIRERTSPDVIVSGHCDTVGSADVNQLLSLKRASAVADALVARGVDRQTIRVTYHGKGNPLVPTPDGVEEPRNRRVEVTVR
jgi:outer membrane protein OmpA-like peptidoglycan-associated protein